MLLTRSRRVLGATAALLCGVVALAATPPPARASLGPTGASAEPLRILVVGDSVSQGSAGDWTWRFRLWEHLDAAGTPADLVGPRDDLYDNIAGVHGSTAYAAPGFDRDHAARWGLTLAFLDRDWALGDLVVAHRPDVVVAALGINDLLFLGHSVERVEADLRGFVAQARSADPGVTVVLSRLPQTWFDRVPALNARMDALAAELDLPSSPIVVAHTDSGFEHDAHTWDGLHPDARGEVLVAGAVADALAGLGLTAPYARPGPQVEPGPLSDAPDVAVGSTTATLTWLRTAGASEDEAEVRDVTAGGEWQPVPPDDDPLSRVLVGLVDGHVHAARVRSAKGWAWGPWSPEVSFRPAPPPPSGRVRLNRLDSPRRDEVRVEGLPMVDATSYQVQVAVVARCTPGGAAAARWAPHGGPVTRPALRWRTPAPAVRVRVVALNLGGPGPAGGSRCVRVR